MEELNAVLGIDIAAATHDQLAKRVFEFCGEMADCYEADSLEANAFQAVQLALVTLNGGTFSDAD